MYIFLCWFLYIYFICILIAYILLFYSFIYIYIFIYLLYCNVNAETGGSESIKTKEIAKKERQVKWAKKRKGIEAQRAKPSTPSQAIDEHIVNEEQKKETGSGSLNRLLIPFDHWLRPSRIIRRASTPRKEARRWKK